MSGTTIVFDLGGVLIDWNPEYLYQQLIPDATERQYFLSHITSSAWNEAQDAGRSLAEGTDWLVRQHPEYEHLIRAFYGRWEEMLAGPIYDNVAQLEALHQAGQHRLLALTNWSAETWPVAVERYPFLDYFEGILVSGQEGIAKPDLAIYRLLEDRYSVKGSEILFVDDNLRNVTAARAVGWRAAHITTPADLRTALGDILV